MKMGRHDLSRNVRSFLGQRIANRSECYAMSDHTCGAPPGLSVGRLPRHWSRGNFDRREPPVTRSQRLRGSASAAGRGKIAAAGAHFFAELFALFGGHARPVPVLATAPTGAA